MHEWALAESVIETAFNAIKNEGLKKLIEINVGIGELQQINQEIFHYALKEILKSRYKEHDQVKIKITIIESTLGCKQCQHEWKFSEMKKGLSDDESEFIHFIPEVTFVHTRCPKCSSPDFEIKTGRGVSINSIKGEK
jgi:hydrogenase nickel incorporation protein HypA/HybF